MNRIKIFIVEPNTFVLNGIKYILQKNKNVEIIYETKNIDQIFEKIKLYNPSIIISEFDNQYIFNYEYILAIRKQFPLICLLLTSTNKNKSDILKLIDLDIHSYLFKHCYENEFINAIKHLINNEKYFAPNVIDCVLNKDFRNCPLNAINISDTIELTKREMQIIKLIIDGFTSTSIASKLFLSIHTINTHRKNIFKKLQIRSTPELTLYALKKGII